MAAKADLSLHRCSQMSELLGKPRKVAFYCGTCSLDNDITLFFHTKWPSMQFGLGIHQLWHEFGMNKARFFVPVFNSSDFLSLQYRKSLEGSHRKLDAHKQLLDIMAHRLHIDNNVELVGKLLFGSERGPDLLKAVRPPGQPLVDDWACLKTMVRTFELYCGSLSQYGMKHMRAMANICNAGVKQEMMADVSAQACVRIPSGPHSSLRYGFSA
ncbi:hypothetical protein ACLOJK_039812 [Asimina triloba]